MLECPWFSPAVQMKHALTSSALFSRQFVLQAQAQARKQSMNTPEQQVEVVSKSARVAGQAEHREQNRQGSILAWAQSEAPMPAAQAATITWYLAVFFFMCAIPFNVVDNYWFRLFVKSLRPSYWKVMPTRNCLATTHLEHIYTDALEVTEAALEKHRGKRTLTLDGHKDGKSRKILTVCICKLFISTFCSCVYMSTRRSTGEHLASIAADYLGDGRTFFAVVADNVAPHLTMFEILGRTYTWLFFMGCFIHVLDLLIEDIAKLPPIASLGRDAHFIVAFVKKHALIYEQFLLLQKQGSIARSLVLYPLTRFAYLYLMVSSVVTN